MTTITALLVAAALLWLLLRPRSPQAEFARLHARWSADAKKRGLAPEQMTAEFQFRYAWARLRRLASDAAIAAPGNYKERLAQIASEEAEILALTDRGVAKRFLSVVDTAPLSDILYPDAFEAVYQASADGAPGPVNDDLLAALRRR